MRIKFIKLVWVLILIAPVAISADDIIQMLHEDMKMIVNNTKATDFDINIKMNNDKIDYHYNVYLSYSTSDIEAIAIKEMVYDAIQKEMSDYIDENICIYREFKFRKTLDIPQKIESFDTGEELYSQIWSESISNDLFNNKDSQKSEISLKQSYKYDDQHNVKEIYGNLLLEIDLFTESIAKEFIKLLTKKLNINFST